MTMIEKVLTRYPMTGNTIVSNTNDENIFLITSFVNIQEKVKIFTTFACTDGEILITYDPAIGELNRYDWNSKNNKWEYYSWTFSAKEEFSEYLCKAEYNKFYDAIKGWLS